MNTTINLKPCPFCGSPAEIVKAIFQDKPRNKLFSGRDRFSTGCWLQCLGEDCGIVIGRQEAYDECEGGIYATPEKAAAVWNKRAI